MNGSRSNPPPILPVGTQIVTRVEIAATTGQPGQPRGAVGIILRSPADSTHAYRIRFVNGGEATLHRKDFSVRKQHQTNNGYVMSQFRKLEQDLRNKGAIKWKHAMHLIRLLLSGITVLREGFVPVRVDEYRDRLLAIRDGDTPWEDINAWRLHLHQRFDDAFTNTRLPEQPDYHKVDAFLIKARRSMVPS